MEFDFSSKLAAIYTPEVVDAVSAIHEYRGKQDLYLATKPDEMVKLCEVAKIQSAKSSNAIEDISTSDARLRGIMAKKIEPKNRDEREIAGYRYVLDMIHESHDYIDITSGIILQFHRDLYRESSASFAGRWKDADNVIQERGLDGVMRTRFVPTSAAGTPAAVESLCEAYRIAMDEGRYDPLVIASLFVFDFVSIHPFNDGNGRMSRLLTLLLLYKSNYQVGKYVSIEGEIERTKETYYEALGASSYGWQDGNNDYLPFVTYLLGTILACYKELDRRMSLVSSDASNEDIVRDYFDNLIGAASKAEIAEACPTMSFKTVERIIQKMLAEGSIEKIGAARSTAYVRRRK